MREASPLDADGPRSAPRDSEGAGHAGAHLIVDLIGASRIDDMAHIEATLRRCVTAVDAELLHLHVHRFAASGGVTGVAVLAESHATIHTWPERDYAAFDLFLCGDAEPRRALAILDAAFTPDEVRVHEHLRGAGV